eukprot:567260-Rhodomonas_salina.3
MRHDTAVSAVQPLDSHAENITRGRDELIKAPNDCPRTEMDAEPVAGAFRRIPPLSAGSSKVCAWVVVLTWDPIVTWTRTVCPTAVTLRHTMDESENQWLASLEVLWRASCEDNLDGPKPCPLTVTQLEPVPRVLAGVVRRMDARWYVAASVILPTKIPAVARIRMLAPFPLALMHTTAELEYQPLASQDVNPIIA